MSKVATASVDRVDDEGIVARTSGEDVVVDVLFDGRRVWSFWVLRDSVAAPHGGDRFVAWPKRLRRFLDGYVPGRAALARGRRGAVRRGAPVRHRRRPDQHRRRAGPAGRHRQRRPAAADLRDPQRRADRAPARLGRADPRRPARDRHRGVPRLRHPARRGPRGPPARARLRRRPRLRQPEDGPGRRDPRVLRDRAPAGRTWATGSSATAAPASRSSSRRATARSAGWTSSAASTPTAT